MSRARARQDVTIVNPEPATLGYASVHEFKASREERVLGVMNVIVGLLSLLVSGAFAIANYDRASKLRLTVGRPVQSDYEFAIQLTTMCSIFMALALLLIAAGVLQLRSDRRSVIAERVYVGLQIIMSIVLADVIIAHLVESSDSWYVYRGAIPGVIAAVYPIALLVTLSTERSRIRKLVHPDDHA